MAETFPKLLVICGPTAVGKTDLAIILSEVFDGELVSADSRQVYKGMDIGTGKDFEKFKNTKIWGYDLVDPWEQFSVSHYQKFAEDVIEKIVSRGKLPILVGGTGLYIKAVLDGVETSHIAQNQTLRKKLSEKSATELFMMLEKIDSKRALSLNESDRQNPRRLTRAIEIVQSGKDFTGVKRSQKYDVLIVGLAASKDFIAKKIEQRVDKRLRQGIRGEVEGLLKKHVSWEMQSMSGLGYKQLREYFEGKKTLDEVTVQWKQDEINYAKRQLTWFRKDKRVKWFNWNEKKSIEKLVKKWYDNAN